MKLQNKVVIITGASSGIGAAAAEAYHQAGARVVLAARDAERLAVLAQKLGGPSQAISVPTDVTRSAECERLTKLTVEHFGRIDVLVNNAGVGHRACFHELTEAEAQQVVAVNFLGVMNVARAVLPCMRQQKSGVIINVSSAAGHIGTPMMSVYCATKFAVRGLTQSLQFELAADGIQAISFCPGYTDTEFFDRAVARKGIWKPGLSKAMSAQAVAAKLVAVTLNPKDEVILSWDGRIQTWANRHFPRLLKRCAMWFFNRRTQLEAAALHKG